MTVRRADSEISAGNGRRRQPASLMEIKEANAKDLPFLKFFASDHLSDPELGVCSLAAKGLYMGILCLMHLARPYGHLLVAGRAPEPEEIARLARCTIEEVEGLLLELESNQVFRRTPTGLLVSPRLLQDEAARQQHIQNGKKGGNPVLIGDRINKVNEDFASKAVERDCQRREKAAERQRRCRAKKKELGHVT